MRDFIDSATAAALQSKTGIAPVNFLWIAGRNRSTGETETMGLSSMWDIMDVDVIDPDTGLSVTRTYHAGGGVLTWPAIPLKVGLEVRTIRIRLSNLNAAVLQAIQGYEPKHAPVQIHRGYLDPDTQLMVAPALPRFIGWINAAPKRIPAVGGEGGIEIACVSDSRKLTFVEQLTQNEQFYLDRDGDEFGKGLDTIGGRVQNITWGTASKPNS